LDFRNNAIILYSPATPVMCHSGGVSKQDDGCADELARHFRTGANCDLPGGRHRRDVCGKAAVKVRGKRANIRRVKRITLAMRRLAAALKRPPFLRLGNENKIGRLSVGNHSDHSINALA
jgi:hypothetical protein